MLTCLAGGRAAADPTPAPPGYSVRSWGASDGLLQGTINGLVRGRSGYVWLATYGGLVRFDGLRFTTFDLNGVLAARTMRISAIAAARDRGVWIGTAAGEVIHAGDEGAAPVVPPLPGPARPVTRLAVGGDGVLRALADGLFMLAGGTWVRVDADAVGAEMTVLPAKTGPTWVGGTGGLARHGHDALTLEPPGVPALGAGRKPLFEDGEGRLWLAASHHLLVRRPDGRVVLPEGSISFAQEPSAVTQDDRGRLWVASGNEIRAFDVSVADETLHLTLVYEYAAIIPGRRILHLLPVGGGIVLAGTDGAGLLGFVPERHVRLDRRHGLPPAPVTHVVSDRRGGMWVAVECKGVVHLAGPALRDDGAGRVPLPDACVRSLYVDRAGALWLGHAGSVSRIGPAGGLAAWDLRDQVGTAAVGAISETTDGRTWIGAGTGCVLRLDVAGEFRPVAPCATLQPDPVTTLTPAPDGSMWAGQIGSVTRFAGDTRSTFDGTHGVPHGEVRGLHVDERGAVWIGTYGGGLARVKGREIVRLRDPALAGSAISGYLNDGRGRVWLLHNRGVFVVDASALDAVADGAGVADGVVLSDVRGIPEGLGGSPAATLLTDGRAAFAAADGLALFDTRAFPFESTPLDTIIESIDSEPHRPAGVTAGAASIGNAFTVRYAAVAFGHAERVQFRYRLVGLEHDWVQAGPERAARYSGLQPGSYRFEVMARSEYGVWGSRPTSVEVAVRPAWWQTWWMRLSALVVAVVALVFVVQLRVEFVRHQGQLRQRRVEDQLESEARARRLERQLAQVTSLATAGELATVVAHELNQPLAAITANAEAGRRLLEMPQPAAYEMSEVLRDIASDGRRAVEVVQALRRLLRRGERQEAPVDMADVIRTVLAVVKRDLQDAAIRLETEIHPSLAAVRGDRILLQQLVLNIVSNAAEALRHSSCERRLTIRARQRRLWVRVSIRDNGGGIARSDLGRIFEPFYTTKPAGMGMGLSISRTIVAAHDGRLRVYNAPAGGAVFVVTLPAWGRS